MVNDEILEKFLNNAVEKAKEQIEKEGKLTVENAIPLLLQSQYNHILHLDQELSLLRKSFSEQFGKIDERFEKMEGRFEKINNRMNWLFGITIAVMSLGFTYIGILISMR